MDCPRLPRAVAPGAISCQTRRESTKLPLVPWRGEFGPRDQLAAKLRRGASDELIVRMLGFHAKAPANYTSSSNPGGGPASCPQRDLRGQLADTFQTCVENPT